MLEMESYRREIMQQHIAARFLAGNKPAGLSHGQMREETNSQVRDCHGVGQVE